MLLRERNKSPSLTLPNKDVQVPRLITCAQMAAGGQGRFLKPFITRFLDFTRDRIDKREKETGTQQRATAIQLDNKGGHASTRSYALKRDRLSTNNEESDNRTSLPSKKFCLEHDFDDAIPLTKPSWECYATEMAENATCFLREHQLKYTIKMFHSDINYKTSDSSRSPAHWTLHRRRVR